jgi:APA family basic amino acid/polyamine antiporter
MALLVMDPGLTAALAVGLAGYAGYIYRLSPGVMKAVAVAAIVLLALINIRGVQLGGSVIRWLTAIKLGLLAFVLVWGFGFHLGKWSNFMPLVDQRPGSEPLLGALGGGFVSAFFSFGGWWDLSKLAVEVRDPARVLPRALLGGVSIITAVYILTSAAFIYLVPLEQVTSGETFAAQVGEILFGSLGGKLFSGIVIVAILGSLAAVIMSAPRVYFAMARDGLFIPAAAAIHPRFRTPARAIGIQTVLACALVLIGSFNSIISYFIFAVVLFIALTVGALFLFRRHETPGLRYQTPGYPATPIVFLILICLLLVLLAGHNPVQAFAGVAVVALGAPVYYLFFRQPGIAQVSPKPDKEGI